MITDTKAAAPRPSSFTGLTPQERKKLAREARKLAMECVENGPQMADDWCGCAVGICVTRAGLAARGSLDQIRLAAQADDLLAESPFRLGLVSIATAERVYAKNPTAVVFPLLALADALDDATEGSP